MITLMQCDISALAVDVIVNAANTDLERRGGVDNAIHRAAGPELQLACNKIGGCPTGHAVMTPGFRLKAKYVIHAVGPVYRDGTKGEATLLAQCYQNAFRLMSSLVSANPGIKTIAVPAISTGVYSYPVRQATVIAARAAREFSKQHPTVSVVFSVFDSATFAIYDRVLKEIPS